MKDGQTLRSLLALCVAAGFLSACSHREKPANPTWDPKAAAAYLDQRETTWIGWPGSARDHGTFCVSCHTVLPYALARSVLRAALSDPVPTENERKILEDVTTRVQLWNATAPYYTDGGYGDGKAVQSRGTESVLNALILASNDARTGKLSDITRRALGNMWALQITDGDRKGAWPWLQFDMEPWEAEDSQYYGATLVAIAIGSAPNNYRSSAAIQDKIDLLRDYLNREYSAQSIMNHVFLLWASEKVPGLIDAERQRAIVHELFEEQRADGGWELSSLAWPKGRKLHSFVRARWRSDWTRQNTESDGYATGLIAFVLQESRISPQDDHLKRGLAWLAHNQNSDDGSWSSLSLSRRRNPSSNVGHFMRDAATAYAVLALSENAELASQGFAGDGTSRGSRLPEPHLKPTGGVREN